MAKSGLNPLPETLPILEFHKKFKPFKSLELTVGFLVFGLFTFCLICTMFYCDGYGYSYRAVEFLVGQKRSSKVEFLEADCDLFDGDWVWDDTYPLYQSKDCNFMDDGFRCSENGRLDLYYTKWRWQPKQCNLPRGCLFQEGEDLQLEMSVETAYKKAMETVLKWIENHIDKNKTQVFFRTFAPVHFRGGDWNTGGHCHLESLPELSSSLVPSEIWQKLRIFSSVLSSSVNVSNTDLQVLNITELSARRKDGHSSVYYLTPPASRHRQDCSHWCLPGVPDTWNELMYALFLKHKISKTWNSSYFQAQT